MVAQTKMQTEVDLYSSTNPFIRQIISDYESSNNGLVLKPREKRGRKTILLEDLVEVLLVVATHGDDEVIGCGGTIARLAMAGEEIYVLHYTDGETGAPSRGEEAAYKEKRAYQAKETDKILGITQRFFLHVPTWGVMYNDFGEGDGERKDALYEATIAMIRYIQPDLILTQWDEDHEGAHRVVSEISRESAYKAGRSSYCDEHGGRWKTPLVWEYEVQDTFRHDDVDYLVNIKGEPLAKKLEAMSANESELKGLSLSNEGPLDTGILNKIIAKAVIRDGCEAFKQAGNNPVCLQ